jgi:ketosteroid isomerase-like protein
MAVIDPNVHWTEMEGGPYGGVYQGAEQVGALLAKVSGDWKGFHPEPQSFIDGGDQIVVLGVYHGTSTQTGKKVDAHFAHVWTVKNDKIVKLVQYTDTHKFHEALK